MAEGKVEIKITGDSKDFEKEAKRAERATKRMGKEIAESGEKMRNFGLGAVAGGALVAKGLASAVNSAADLGESVSKAGVLFGDSTEIVTDFGEGAAEALGQSKREAVDAASKFAVFGKSAGLTEKDLAGFSTELVTLAGDMASFNNVSPEETINAIGSALAGEAEPMKRFGVLLNDATLKARAMKMGLISTTTEALSPQNKVLAAHAEIMAQTTDQQGDFARTQDSLPNKLRQTSAQFENMKAEIGEKLLPVADKLVGTATRLLDLFDSLPAPLQSVATYGAAAGSGIAIIGGTAAIGIGQVRKWRGELMASGNSVRGLAGSLKSNLNPAIVGGTIAIGAGIALYGKWHQAQQKIKNETDDMADAIVNGEDAFERMRTQFEKLLDEGDGAEEAFRKTGISAKTFIDTVDQVGVSMDHVRHLWHESNGALSTFETRLRTTDEAVPELAFSLLELAQNETITEKEMGKLLTSLSDLEKNTAGSSAEIAEQVDQLRKSKDAAKFTREEQELLNEALEADTLTEQQAALLEFTAGNKDAAKAVGINTDAIDETTDALEESTDATDDAADALKEYRDQVLAQFDPVFNYQKSLDDVADAIVGAHDAQKEFGDGSRQHNEALRNLAQANSAADAAVVELKNAFNDGSISVEVMRQRLGEWVERGRMSQDQADRLAWSIGVTKAKADSFGSPTLKINTWEAEVRLRKTQDYLNNIRGILDSIRNSQGLVITGGSSLRREQKATGGRVHAGKGYIVGERGPELFDPDVNGTIIPNHKLAYATAGNTVAPGGGGVTINVTALDPKGAANAVMNAIQQYERSNGTAWRN